MSTTTATILNNAADYIEENGWCRGNFFDPRGQACLMGAIGVASGALIPTKEGSAARTQHGLYRWSKDKAKQAAYFKAGAVLAPFVSGKPVLTRDLEEFDHETQLDIESEWFKARDEAGQKQWLKQREESRLSLFADHVMDANDGAYLTGGKRRWRATKSQAIKLLRKAAATV